MKTLISANPKALEFVKTPQKMFIGGEWVEALSGKTTPTINPTSGEQLTSIAAGGPEDVDRAVLAARKAFENSAWSKMKPAERALLLNKLADLLEDNSEELSHIEALDTGKVAKNVPHTIKMASNYLRYYAGWPTKLNGSTIPVSNPGNIFTYTRKEPIGVCGQITPWNGPLMSAIMKLGAPLACGNTVVLKPSKETSLSTLRLGHLIQEAGFPDGVVNIITGSGTTIGRAMSGHRDIDKISFTGSTEVGKEIMQAAAGNVKRVTLELGGKSANIIFADADYEKALANAANAIFLNAGQMCLAGSRLFVEKKIYDNFLSDLAEYSKRYKVGHNFDMDTVIGPMTTLQQKNKVLEYLDIGVDEGAELVIGGDGSTEPGLTDGYYVQPSIMANVNNNMRIAQEEIFGPVVTAMPFTNIEEVIDMANDSPYGLGGGICTTDIRKAHKVAHALRTGSVWINTYNLLDPGVPFGGYKQSGIGLENGVESLEAYTESKSIWVDLD